MFTLPGHPNLHCVILQRAQLARPLRERVLFIGTQFSILYTSMYSPCQLPSCLAPSWPPVLSEMDCTTQPAAVVAPLQVPRTLQPGETLKERVLFIGTQFSILYTSMYSPAEAATPRA